VVWEAMQAVRDAGLTRRLGVAPGPANGFTLDLIDCMERNASLIDWAMIILNPLEPWPGELVLDAAAEHRVDVITRVVDYGGIFHDDVLPGHPFAEYDHRKFRPGDWVAAGREKLERMRPIAERHGLSMLQLACAWNFAQPAVRCVAPTLIQESGSTARSIEEKRAELATFDAERMRLSAGEIQAIREIGENTGCMALKGASVEHGGPALADRWHVYDELTGVAQRWGIDPARDLARHELAAG
jgi:aryl-alcohol dehydrogenase-like predicted oxidoreductase